MDIIKNIFKLKNNNHNRYIIYFSLEDFIIEDIDNLNIYQNFKFIIKNEENICEIHFEETIKNYQILNMCSFLNIYHAHNPNDSIYKLIEYIIFLFKKGDSKNKNNIYELFLQIFLFYKFETNNINIAKYWDWDNEQFVIGHEKYKIININTLKDTITLNLDQIKWLYLNKNNYFLAIHIPEKKDGYTLSEMYNLLSKYNIDNQNINLIKNKMTTLQQKNNILFENLKYDIEHFKIDLFDEVKASFVFEESFKENIPNANLDFFINKNRDVINIIKNKIWNYENNKISLLDNISLFDKYINNIKIEYPSTSDDELNNLKIDIENSYKLIDYENNHSYTNLIYGQIQSGKTRFIIGLILKILENKHNTLIVFLSNSNNYLLNQNKNRIYNDINKIINNHKTTFNIIGFEEMLDDFDDSDYYIISLIKQKDNLEKLRKFLSFKKYYKKIVIIDDECDIETYKEDTILNECLKDILIQSKDISYSYFRVTATPFHILEEPNKSEIFEINNTIMLKPFKGYFGLNELSIAINDNNSNIVEKINFENSNDIFSEIKKAVIYYYIQCFKIRNDNFFPRMIINYSIKQKKQEELCDFLNKFFLKICNNDLTEINKIKKYFKSFFKNNFNEDEFIQFIDWIKKLNANKKNTLTIFNSKTNKSNKEIFDLDHKDIDLYRIVIGGKKIARGVTIKDLISSFLFYNSDNFENKKESSLLQEARWFGYRDKTWNISKIFLTIEFQYSFCLLNFKLQCDKLLYSIYQYDIHKEYKNKSKYIYCFDKYNDLLSINEERDLKDIFFSMENSTYELKDINKIYLKHCDKSFIDFLFHKKILNNFKIIENENLQVTLIKNKNINRKKFYLKNDIYFEPYLNTEYKYEKNQLYFIINEYKFLDENEKKYGLVLIYFP